jgi:cyclohexa-1,5-dienecarbonyl-CoA hydratase
LPKLIGPAKSLELILTGDIITAVEAKQIGLVGKVVPSEKLDDCVREIISKLREKSPVVLKLTRMSLRQVLDVDFRKELEEVTGIYLNNLVRTEDAVEGLKAFMEKRKPLWKGK